MRVVARRFIWMPLLAAASAGCSSISYEHIRLGAGPSEYARVLPQASTRPTAIGLAHLNARGPQGEAIVVLLTEQRRVAGKLLVQRAADPAWLMQRRPAYRLTGEIDAGLYGVEQTSPVDVLRMIAGELAAIEGEPFVRDAHAWVAAGLLRWLERWPGVTDFALSEEQLPRLRELAPPAGSITLQRSGAGRLQFEYRVD